MSLFVTFSALAEVTPQDVEKDQFRSVTDAIFLQHRIRLDESLRAIINYKDNVGGRVFIVQYIDAKGNCSQESADVVTERDSKNAEGIKSFTTFYRVARVKCQ